MKPPSFIIPYMLTSMFLGLTACAQSRINASARFQQEFNQQTSRSASVERESYAPSGLAGILQGVVSVLWLGQLVNRPQGWRSDEYTSGNVGRGHQGSRHFYAAP